jgi:conjugative transfer signal peptidase TraF
MNSAGTTRIAGPMFIRRYLLPAAFASAGLLGIGAILGAAGARINTSKSIAVGLYWNTDRPVQRGEYVLFCPPDSIVMAEARQRGYLTTGFCPGDYGYMMKRIVALGGDVVTVASEGVRVNGQLLPFSAPLGQDGSGRAMPRLQGRRFVLGASEVLLMTDASRTSFDARYFGPIGRSQIRTVIVPVLTW